ncbi:hypothetical protein ACLKM7_03765 [Microbacterium sp. I2]|uniref:hypothetical protein n=1 Tax=Microbacterium sp. I2 TaxID=3391826 RepID=UPI003ED9D638
MPPRGEVRARLGLTVPAGWQVREVRGPIMFVTRAQVVRPDGSLIDWSSRRHRKGLAPLPADARHSRGQREPVRGASASSWWMGGLFMVGGFCFALGSMPLFFDRVDVALVGWVFFIGSVFFTSAAYLQFRECAAAPDSLDPLAPRRHGIRSFVGWRPRSVGWWAAAVQLAGTILFNVSTFAATRESLALDQEKHLIWAPDLWGSVCFLVASALAYAEVSPHVWRRPRGDVGWNIALLNLVGSVAFGLAAVAARYLPTTGEPANIALVNLGTFLGAVCFFVGAALLPVESAGARARTSGS